MAKPRKTERPVGWIEETWPDLWAWHQEEMRRAMEAHREEVERGKPKARPQTTKTKGMNIPFDSLGPGQALLYVRRFWDWLPERDRDMLYLYYWEGRTYREIGEMYRLSGDRVWQIIGRAKRSARLCLEKTRRNYEYGEAAQN